jgi:hypothetical protein
MSQNTTTMKITVSVTPLGGVTNTPTYTPSVTISHPKNPAIGDPE